MTFRFILILTFTGSALYAQNIEEMHTPLERGKHVNGQRLGIWEYYDKPGKPTLVIDYSAGRLTYFEPDTSDYLIWQGNKWTKSKLTIPCRYQGSIVRLWEHYQAAAWDPLLFELKDSLSREASLIFEVTEDGIAVNPEVTGDFGTGTKKILLRAFDTAPNQWLMGVTPAGSAVRCKMSITFRRCVRKDCGLPNNLNDRSPEAKRLLLFQALPAPPSTLSNRGNVFAAARESSGIAYSPDDSRILCERIIENDGSKRLAWVIVDLETKLSRAIPFTNMIGAKWLDSDRVIFKYAQDTWPILTGVYDYNTGYVSRDVDSATYFHTVSSTQMVAFANQSENGVTIWQQSLIDGATKPILRGSMNRALPVEWSADGKKLMILETDNRLLKLSILDVTTGQRTLIPVYNTQFIGWSEDCNTIYMTRYQNFAMEILKYDVATDMLTRRKKGLGGLTSAQFNRASNKMLLGMNGHGYELDLSIENSTPKRIIKKPYMACWNHSGESIAYIDVKSGELHIYNVAHGTSRQATLWALGK